MEEDIFSKSAVNLRRPKKCARLESSQCQSPRDKTLPSQSPLHRRPSVTVEENLPIGLGFSNKGDDYYQMNHHERHHIFREYRRRKQVQEAISDSMMGDQVEQIRSKRKTEDSDQSKRVEWMAANVPPLISRISSSPYHHLSSTDKTRMTPWEAQYRHQQREQIPHRRARSGKKEWRHSVDGIDHVQERIFEASIPTNLVRKQEYFQESQTPRVLPSTTGEEFSFTRGNLMTSESRHIPQLSKRDLREYLQQKEEKNGHILPLYTSYSQPKTVKRRRIKLSNICPKFNMASRRRRAEKWKLEQKKTGILLDEPQSKDNMVGNDKKDREDRSTADDRYDVHGDNQMSIFTRFLALKHERLQRLPPRVRRIEPPSNFMMVPLTAVAKLKRPRQVTKRLPNGMACHSCRIRKVRCNGTRPCLQCCWRNEVCSDAMQTSRQARVSLPPLKFDNSDLESCIGTT
mmetsp:Transcript_2825/g.4337  ORF Transcript_2825/g.4337 Transcript_2825/m.4337 type:complete len:459 (-) Transcript_2825:118-1494(-)